MLEFGGSYAGAYLLRRGLFMPWELGDVLERDIVEQGLRRLAPLQPDRARARAASTLGAYAKVATLEASLYMRNQLLRDTDWASMAHSLEVRVPLVDSVLLRQDRGDEQRSSPIAGNGSEGASGALSQHAVARKHGQPREDRLFDTDSALAAGRIGWRVRGTAATRCRVPRTAHWSRQWAERLAGRVDMRLLALLDRCIWSWRRHCPLQPGSADGAARNLRR